MNEAISIYILIDPRDGRVRYVGQTNDPRRRFRNHVLGHDASGAMRKAWIQSLLDAGFALDMRVIGEVDRTEARAAEREAIEFFSSTGHPLTNASDTRHASRRNFPPRDSSMPSLGRPALGPAKRRRYTVHLTPMVAAEVEQQAATAGIAPGRMLARIVEAQLVGAKRASKMRRRSRAA